LAAAIGAGEERVLAIERDRPDGSLDGVGIDLDAPVVEEAGEALPAGERVADRLGEPGLLADEFELGLEPGLERLDDRAALLLARAAALVGGATADLALDRVERGDALQRLAGDRRGPGDGELVEAPAHMSPAEGELDVAALGERAVAAIAIDLQHALEAGQVGHRPLGLAIGGVDIRHAGRIGATPGSVVAGVGPELPGLGPAAAGIEHRRASLVGEQLR